MKAYSVSICAIDKKGYIVTKVLFVFADTVFEATCWAFWRAYQEYPKSKGYTHHICSAAEHGLDTSVPYQYEY